MSEEEQFSSGSEQNRDHNKHQSKDDTGAAHWPFSSSDAFIDYLIHVVDV